MTTQQSKQLLFTLLLLLNGLIVFGQQTAVDTTVYPLGAVEEKPLFEGKGDTAIFRFIAMNVRLPMSARKIIGTTGKVFIYFVIDEKGQLNAKSVKMLFFQPGTTAKEPKPKKIADEALLDAAQLDCVVESKRVISLLKKWSAAKIGGKGVKCSMTMPIGFKNE
jgi:hypothetical protein